jgi:hypothetical protein
MTIKKLLIINQPEVWKLIQERRICADNTRAIGRNIGCDLSDCKTVGKRTRQAVAYGNEAN